MVKIGKYIGFSVYRRSYLLWPPVVAQFQGVCLDTGESANAERYLDEISPKPPVLLRVYVLSVFGGNRLANSSHICMRCLKC